MTDVRHSEPEARLGQLPPNRNFIPNPQKVLQLCCWADPTFREEDWQIEELTTSHQLLRASTADGREVIIKHRARESNQTERTLRNELFIYRLAAWMPALGAIIPDPIYIDEQHDVLVIESLTYPGNDFAGQSQTQILLTEPGVGAEVAAAVATLHSATAQLGMWPSLAVGILGLTQGLEEAMQGRVATTQELMRAIQQTPVFRAALQAGLDTYAHECVIHGDLKPANWLYKVHSAQPGLRLIDWELSGSGDPCWDLGSLLAQVLMECIHQDGPADDPRLLRSHPAIRAIVRSYGQTRRATAADFSMDWQKTAIMVVARLLHVATECSERGVLPAEWPVRAYVQVAEQIAASLSETALALERCEDHGG